MEQILLYLAPALLCTTSVSVGASSCREARAGGAGVWRFSAARHLRVLGAVLDINIMRSEYHDSIISYGHNMQTPNG